MFLARKTENFLMTIGDFSTAIKSSPAAILNLEFLVCKSLRFQFTVHHPYRPCLGFFYDMQVPFLSSWPFLFLDDATKGVVLVSPRTNDHLYHVTEM
jgi:hypothetical protein